MAVPPISVGLPSFNGAGGSIFRFIEDFKTFSVLQGWGDEKQVALLPLCLSGIARDAYDALSDKYKRDISAAFEQLKAAFPADSSVEAQVQLRSLRFQPGNSLDAFVVQLRGLVSRAFPGTDRDGLLFNYFLQALPTAYQQELISNGIQNFDAAVSKVRNMSCAARLVDSASQSVRQITASEADALRQRIHELESRLTRLQSSQSRPSAGRTGPASGRGRVCFCCGMTGHVQAVCRKRLLSCHTCGATGHLARVCRQSVNAQRAGAPPYPRPESRQPQAPGVQRGPGPLQWDVRPQDQRPRMLPSPPRTSQPPTAEPARGRST